MPPKCVLTTTALHSRRGCVFKGPREDPGKVEHKSVEAVKPQWIFTSV